MSERIPVLYNKKPCYDILLTDSFGELVTELKALDCEAESSALSRTPRLRSSMRMRCWSCWRETA